MARIQRALISVSDKNGIVELGRALGELGIEILSTGGTAKALRDAGVGVVDVATYTESPEIMDGRVKTLHPRVHGGILMRDTTADRSALASIGGRSIDLVIVNLYPFEATVASGADRPTVIENIDIGGPSMLRSAAKNHDRVTVVTDPADYDEVLAQIRENGETSSELRARLAARAFSHTAAYDGAISAYLTSDPENERSRALPGRLTLSFDKAYDCRYGENPHQDAAFYIEVGAPEGSLARAQSIGSGGKELSFNNFVDVDAALDCVRELAMPGAVVVKHTNPCGVAEADSLADAYRTARDADALSAFGGIVALNREVDLATAEIVAETFIECIVAPSFAADALERLQSKKNLRILATGAQLAADHEARTFKRIDGGLVVQGRDYTAADEVADGKIVTERAPTAEELAALDLGWKVCKHVKSNAIVLAKKGRTVGVGAGQMSRVVSVELAVQKAGEDAVGSVLASDAFFPFPDGVETAAKAGVTAIAQPGGSKKDPEVIAAANAAGIAMVFTSTRHFRH